jgi:16S rRNA (adenine1518-N6/adenine1519-N6)-dimethyltransferase
MLKAGGVTTRDTVVEVGPGTGFLTNELLKAGARVIAIETDPRMVEALRARFGKECEGGQLRVIEQDIRKTNPEMLGLQSRRYKVVANIPYFLSGFLLRLFLSSEIQPSCLVFLVQKEIAERIARSKKESLLSLSVKAYGVPAYIQTVKAGSFTPPPKIASAVLAVKDISRGHFRETDEAFFFDILHLGFASKRKQLLGNLAKHFDRMLLVHIFSTLGIKESIRGEDLPLTTWLALAHALETHRK